MNIPPTAQGEVVLGSPEATSSANRCPEIGEPEKSWSSIFALQHGLVGTSEHSTHTSPGTQFNPEEKFSKRAPFAGRSPMNGKRLPRIDKKDDAILSSPPPPLSALPPLVPEILEGEIEPGVRGADILNATDTPTDDGPSHLTEAAPKMPMAASGHPCLGDLFATAPKLATTAGTQSSMEADRDLAAYTQPIPTPPDGFREKFATEIAASARPDNPTTAKNTEPPQPSPQPPAAKATAEANQGDQTGQGALGPIHGTPVAEQHSMMNSHQDRAEIAEWFSRGFLVRQNSTGDGRRVAAPVGPLSRPNHRTGRDATTELATVTMPDANGQPPADTQEIRTAIPSPLIATRITEQAVHFKASGLGSLAVVLKPDSRTEIHLQFVTRNGQIEAQARCEHGDRQQLAAQWPQLQETLQRHGVRLLSLTGSNDLQDGAGERQGNPQTVVPSVEPGRPAGRPAVAATPPRTIQTVIKQLRLLDSWA